MVFGMVNSFIYKSNFLVNENPRNGYIGNNLQYKDLVSAGVLIIVVYTLLISKLQTTYCP